MGCYLKRLRRLPETFRPDDAGLTFAFQEGWREHSELCDLQPDTEGGRQDKSDGMKVDRNRLSPQSCNPDKRRLLPPYSMEDGALWYRRPVAKMQGCNIYIASMLP